MRTTQLFGRTSKTEGTDLTIDSHRLLVQAGFIRESSAGRYYLLPLGLKVHDKIVGIIRKHMDASGAQEVVMPVLHPLELWQETNRTNTTGFELMTIEDRRGASFALGGTAEEMAVDLVRKFNLSYKDLPFNIYQFSMKFRDEMRSRGGLLRVREFVMKDAYSFSTEEQFKEIYQQMWDAYTAIFNEIGLQTDVVASDNGYIGGDYCHEFVVPAEVGESRYFVTEDSSYAAHEDIATFEKYHEVASDEEMLPLKEVKGENMIGVEDLAKFLKIPVEKTTKTILFETEKGEVIAAAVNGLYDVNETKLQHIVGCAELQLASAETVKRVTKAEVGYAGFINLPKEVRVVLDESVKGRKNFEVGANHTHYHTVNANFGRDFPEPEQFYDIAMARPGDFAEGTKKKLHEKRGIEVGNIFQLGYHYTNLMQGADFTTEEGKNAPYYMGCYGIGVGRTMAAVAEVLGDERGLVWPANIAPAKVYMARLGEDKDVVQAADKLYEELQHAGVEVLYDDRDVRPGEKFADADLIGLPYRLVVSQKSLANNQVELKKRTATEVTMVDLDKIVKSLKEAK